MFNSDIIKRPVEPKEEDCCNTGCTPCIFDVYKKQLQLYEKYLEGDENIATQKENEISQLEYSPFLVIDNFQILNNSHSILALKSLNDKKVWWKPGNHFVIKYSTDGTMYTRAYSPIKIQLNTKENFHFAVIIKKYDKGAVSNYLCTLKTGSQILWRGPCGDYEVVSNKFSRIIMIAQGTGIAPFYSIIDNMLENEDDMTKIVLLYCCESLDKVLFRDELYSFRLYWNFKYYIYTSKSTQNLVCKYQEPVINKRFSIKEIETLRPICKNDQFLVCGSSQFMTEYNIGLKNDFNVLAENIVMF